jgi:hypothetical protein
VRRDVAASEEAAVDLRMERLHAPVEHLGESGVVAHLAHAEARVGEELRRPARRQELDAELREPLRQLDEAALVADAQECPSHLSHAALLHNAGARGDRSR